MGAKTQYDFNQVLLDVYGDPIDTGDPKQKEMKLGAASVRALMGGSREPKDETQLIKRDVLARKLVSHDDSDDDYKVLELQKRQRNLLKDALHETFGGSPLIYVPAIIALGFEAVDDDDEDDDDEQEQAESEDDEDTGDE